MMVNFKQKIKSLTVYSIYFFRCDRVIVNPSGHSRSSEPMFYLVHWSCCPKLGPRVYYGDLGT